jgi:hypothetical protein
MRIDPRGSTSVWIKTSQGVATLARRVPWKRLSGTKGQLPSRTKTIINSKTLNHLVRLVRR